MIRAYLYDQVGIGGRHSGESGAALVSVLPDLLERLVSRLPIRKIIVCKDRVSQLGRGIKFAGCSPDGDLIDSFEQEPIAYR